MPVFALGFSDTAMAAYGLLYYWRSPLVHSNVKFAIGFLRGLVTSPRFHHRHHANTAESYDKNCAGQLAMRDVCFGTLHMPADQYPQKCGTCEPVPRLYTKQLTYPFTASRLAASADDQPEKID